MSQLTPEDMSRLVVAGTKSQLKTTIDVLAGLSLVHINDYSSDDEELSMGTPSDVSEEISRRLTKMRGAAASMQTPSQTELMSAPEVRRNLSGDIDDLVENALSLNDEMESLETEAAQIDEELGVLALIAPLSLEMELMSGYDSVTQFVGTVSSLSKARPALASLGDSAIHMSSEVAKKGVVAVFCRNEQADSVQKMLSEHDFLAISIPESEGLPSERIAELNQRKGEIEARTEALQNEISEWSNTNSGMLFGGMELLERDLQLATAPVRVAVSDHAFVLDGWISSAAEEDVKDALAGVCTHVDIERYEPPAHSSHGHHHEEQKKDMPPIEFSPRNYSKPFEMVTDVMGRPAYGKIDPTFFMFLTYPIFFGMILGDMAYGLSVMALAAFIWRKFPLDETMSNVGGFLFTIGTSTLIFGYIYGEFAGFEFLPHGHCVDYAGHHIDGIIGVSQCEAHILSDGSHGHYHWKEGHAPWWVSWMTNLYPNGGEFYWVWEGPLGLTLAYPFHRVSTNLENLILITIYIGVIHIFIGLMIGFRDVFKTHGLVDAIFEKGSWMVLLIGGFASAYEFLKHGAEFGAISTLSLAVTGAGVVMVMVLLAHYEKMGWAIGIPMGVLESLGMLPKVVSYVRLFAVGVVGVKIAATGNEMIYEGMAHTLSDLSHASTLDIVLIPIMFIGWILVQLFALVLGIFSPNIHTVRLHFVEWMMQFYEGSGLPFKAFGFKPDKVEVE
ncbi:MAG: V-type ATP synthase subunit I [Candidatus Thermoplasmatota archaeon]|nr:V-type ATP synthase subunit I [Candidatus Thermoplasmatota archaeon]